MDIAFYFKHPENLNKETLYDLRSLLALYPYYQPVRILLLQNLFLLHDPTFDEELRRRLSLLLTVVPCSGSSKSHIISCVMFPRQIRWTERPPTPQNHNRKHPNNRKRRNDKTGRFRSSKTFWKTFPRKSNRLKRRRGSLPQLMPQ